MTNEPKGAGYTRYNTPSTPHTHPRLQSEPCPNQNERDELDKYVSAVVRLARNPGDQLLRNETTNPTKQ